MALAEDAFVYPKNDQSMEQQQKDKFECYNWAKGQTGFDPQEQQNYARWEQQEAARYAEQRSRYDRANKACMEARDYSVS